MKRFPLVKMYNCEMCEQWLSSKDVQVDHNVGHNSLRSVDDVGSFVKAMLEDCSFDDYSILCKPCHEVKSYSDAHSITIEQAVIEKEIIKINKMKASDLDKWLLDKGITNYKRNSDGRKGAVRVYLEGCKDVTCSN